MSNMWATHTKVTVDEILRTVVALRAEVQELKEVKTMTSQLALEVKMYLGLNIPDSSVVYESEFREFLTDIVDPRFDGYNIQKCEGKWKGETEDCYVLTFIVDEFEYPSVITIAKLYKGMFGQDSVLVTRKQLDGAVFV